MEQLVQSLRETLGTAFSLYVNTHGAHWNVEGPDFYQLHKLLDDQYRDIWESLDGIAENIRALDAYSPQSMERFIELSRIPSADPAPFVARDALLNLMKGHEIIIDLMSETLAIANELGEQGVVNFLGDRIEAHKKHRWMLRVSAKPQVMKA